MGLGSIQRTSWNNDLRSGLITGRQKKENETREERKKERVIPGETKIFIEQVTTHRTGWVPGAGFEVSIG